MTKKIIKFMTSLSKLMTLGNNKDTEKAFKYVY